MAKTYEHKFNSFKIRLPFKLNQQQVDAINQIDAFINSSARSMTLSGWAGTGKTTLMYVIAKRYWYTHKVHFCATTHKAAGVLKSKVKHNVSTVNSLFGINVEVDMDGDYFDATKKKNTKGTEKLKSNSIVFIDEASMLNEENYQEVLKCCQFYHSKVIFIGDSAQLAPVNEEDISIVFRDKQAQLIELTEVKRTEDDGILKESINVRLNGHFTYQDSETVKYISRTDKKGILDVIDRNIELLKTDPDSFRILTYTNDNVEKLNLFVRNKLGYGISEPKVGEPMMSYANWGFLGSYPTTTYKFVNSETYVCGEIIKTIKLNVRDKLLSCNEDTFLDISYLELFDSLGERIIVPYIDVKNNKDNYKVATLLAFEKIGLWREYRNAKKKVKKEECLEKINEIDDLLFVNDTIKSVQGYVLQQKVIDFGYAHTIHKSQGSTFKNVIINDVDINICTDDNIKKQLRYVGVTRATDSVTIIID